MRLYIGCGTRRVTSTTMVLAILADTTGPIFSFLIFFVSDITRAGPLARYPFLTFVVPAILAPVLLARVLVGLVLAALALAALGLTALDTALVALAAGTLAALLFADF